MFLTVLTLQLGLTECISPSLNPDEICYAGENWLVGMGNDTCGALCLFTLTFVFLRVAVNDGRGDGVREGEGRERERKREEGG